MAWLFRIPKKSEEKGEVKIHISPEDGSPYINTSDLMKSDRFKNQVKRLREHISEEYGSQDS